MIREEGKLSPDTIKQSLEMMIVMMLNMMMMKMMMMMMRKMNMMTNEAYMQAICCIAP